LTLEGLRIIYERNQAHAKRRSDAASNAESHDRAATSKKA
jgi:hypothetical protein